MNSVKSCSVLFFLVLSCSVAQAAVFEVVNQGANTVYVRPIWSGRGLLFDRVEPGQSIRYDSGFNNVTGMRWAEVVPVKEGGTLVKGQMLVKSFETDVKVGFLNLGGNFKIQNSGSFNYYFGVDSGLKVISGSASPVDGL